MAEAAAIAFTASFFKECISPSPSRPGRPCGAGQGYPITLKKGDLPLKSADLAVHLLPLGWIPKRFGVRPDVEQLLLPLLEAGYAAFDLGGVLVDDCYFALRFLKIDLSAGELTIDLLEARGIVGHDLAARIDEAVRRVFSARASSSMEPYCCSAVANCFCLSAT